MVEQIDSLPHRSGFSLNEARDICEQIIDLFISVDQLDNPEACAATVPAKVSIVPVRHTSKAIVICFNVARRTYCSCCLGIPLQQLQYARRATLKHITIALLVRLTGTIDTFVDTVAAQASGLSSWSADMNRSMICSLISRASFNETQIGGVAMIACSTTVASRINLPCRCSPLVSLQGFICSWLDLCCQRLVRSRFEWAGHRWSSIICRWDVLITIDWIQYPHWLKSMQRTLHAPLCGSRDLGDQQLYGTNAITLL